MSSTILNDPLQLSANIASGGNPGAPKIVLPFKGVLYEEFKDDYGKPLLKKVGENTVTVGGAITTLLRLCGTNHSCQFIPKTFNEELGIQPPTDASRVPTTKDTQSVIALFGVGAGGHSSDASGTGSNVWNAVAEKDIKKTWVPDYLPMRTTTAITTEVDEDGTTLTKDEDLPNKYYMKRAATDAAKQTITEDGVPVYDWYLKEVKVNPVIQSNWKDSTDEEGLGTLITADIMNETREEGVQVLAEFVLHLTENDVREGYVKRGNLANAMFNSIGLYTGVKTELADGSFEYTNVRLFSYLNIDTKSLRIKTESTYRYRILAIV